MSNEEIVICRLNKMAKSPLSFREGFWYCTTKDSIKNVFGKSIKERVFNIIRLSKSYPTYIGNSRRFQCFAASQRSAHDIWRIYRYYFGETDIFSILRVLYSLSKEKKIYSGYCFTTKKRVFNCTPGDLSFHDYTDWEPKGELGVSIRYWKEIGL